ncbi:MAG: DUF4315 family protein [Clostridiales bacterium]|nr:DUF4315 family protein [Clostridiales bacterium]
MVNRKLPRYLDDIESTEKKIAELQQHLEEVRSKQKVDEDLEIVKSIRAKKMTGRELLAFLEGIQNGTLVIVPAPDMGTEDEKPETTEVQEAPEREDRNDENDGTETE